MKSLKSVVFVILFSNLLFSQGIDTYFEEPGNHIRGGLGITWIDGVPYTTFRLAPEFSFGKLGIGLNIELLFDNSNGFEFRQAGWSGEGGALRMINYVRWGLKHDPLYIRVGTLQAATLGTGFIMGYYNNGVNYDERKIGLVFDADFGSFGFESGTSNILNLEIIGGRFYVRPLRKITIPILKNLEVGATYATDVDPDAKGETDDAIAIWGADLSIPIIRSELFESTIYATYADILNYGNGTAIGISAGIPNFIGVFGIHAKLEKRFLGDKFLPNYFNALYELERNQLNAQHYNPNAPAELMTKQDYLSYVSGNSGIFGELAGHILGRIRLLGNYQYTDGIKYSGIMHLEALMKGLIPGIRLRYTYDKSGIESFEDVYTLDYRSVAVGEIGYKTAPFIYITLRYRWNYVYDAAKNEYRPQERFEPGVSFAMEF